MGSNGAEDMKISGNDTAGCSETTVEIKIKTLDSQTYTLRVDKCVPVPQLKEKIASVTGVLSEQQRLICRGKVLKDDQLLSAYHVEDGHTLHLVVRQPVIPSSDGFDLSATDPISSIGNNSGNQVGPGVVVGTFNISEQGDGAFPDLNRIVSTVLNSFGIARMGSGSEGIDLNQPRSERISTAPSLGGLRNSNRLHSYQAVSNAVPEESPQPPIIPDSLTTLSQYLSHLRQEFHTHAGGQSRSFQTAGPYGSDAQDSHATSPSTAQRGLPTPELLAELFLSTRQILVEQAAECLLQLAGQLQGHENVTDPLERSIIQTNAIRSGVLFQNLSSLLLELGRTTMTLRMGQTPADALVNAGPSVFISSTGPNPIMVQPLPFQPGENFGANPLGTVQNGSGLSGGSIGSGFLPRNIDIRVRTGSLLSRRESTDLQSQGHGVTVSSTGGNSGQQAALGLDPNSVIRDSEVRAIPIRTMVAAVPASGERGSNSPHGSLGIVYPVLARVQHVTSGNSSSARASQASEQHRGHDTDPEQQTMPDSAPQQQNIGPPGGNGSGTTTSEASHGQGFSAQIQSGLGELLRTIFPGEHIFGDIVSSPPDGAAQDARTSQEAAETASREGILLSNILHQIMPVIQENSASNGGSNSSEPQDDENRDQGAAARQRCGPQSQPSTKRPRRE
ncbi:ubiquitin domain-containing DSK2a-like isoform X1 [Olea europaea subsp. europaea]|uniref:Ubiquitin domain-containing DSK2a-like isoform X1 n=2 Tax=Olea europaea subsp. europaea TaxID=158383 RepID=A0A8S0RY75_OLEEU|nr:ubiquitin domain-containing DSK2a-like isoform X1 [Olea europaea subsp. europaea]